MGRHEVVARGRVHVICGAPAAEKKATPAKKTAKKTSKKAKKAKA